MRNLSILIFFFFCLSSVQSQKVIEKTLEYNNQYIDLDVRFASIIEVKTWDKSTVYFKADVYSEEKQYLDLYKLDINKSSRSITITSDATPMFETSRKDCLKKHKDRKRYCYNNGDLFEFKYTLYVPRNAKFAVSSINGDLKSEIIEGNFTADLINGDIEIASYDGDLDLKTINGAIDLKIKDAYLTAETIHGDIYADEKLQLNSSNRHVGQKISGKVKSGKNRLQLNTINGNMYLRI